MECPVRTQTATRVELSNPLAQEVALTATITGTKQVGGGGGGQGDLNAVRPGGGGGRARERVGGKGCAAL